jgi:hypothetical protein
LLLAFGIDQRWRAIVLSGAIVPWYLRWRR